MERVTVEDVDSWAYRGVELVYMLPLAVFLGGALWLVARALAAGTGLASTLDGLSWPLLVAGGALGVLWTLATPFFLYRDAKRVERADTSWDLSPTLYTLSWLLGGWFTVAFYLYQRHRFVVDRDRGDRWWLVLAGSLVSFLAVAALPFLAYAATGLALGQAFVVSLVGAAAVSVVTVVAMYFDSIHVRLNSKWHPNPATKVCLGTLAVFVPVLVALYGTYHLVRRRMTLGLG